MNLPQNLKNISQIIVMAPYVFEMYLKSNDLMIQQFFWSNIVSSWRFTTKKITFPCERKWQSVRRKILSFLADRILIKSSIFQAPCKRTEKNGNSRRTIYWLSIKIIDRYSVFNTSFNLRSSDLPSQWKRLDPSMTLNDRRISCHDEQRWFNWCCALR